jgi:hypothetical protein
MTESGKNCVECGRPVAMFSGITINGAAYHNHCWDNGRRIVPKAPLATGPDEARSSGYHYARPRVMPAVEPLQLGRAGRELDEAQGAGAEVGLQSNG